MSETKSTADDWRAKPATLEGVSLAFGAAARYAVRFGLNADQAARLMQSAWYIVQDKESECYEKHQGIG